VTSRATLFRDAVVVFRTPGQGVQAAQHQPTPALAAQGEFLKRFFYGQVTLCQSGVSVAEGRKLPGSTKDCVPEAHWVAFTPFVRGARAPQGKNQQVILKYCHGFFGFCYKRISLLVPYERDKSI
jgi:hypothetical protein